MIRFPRYDGEVLCDRGMFPPAPERKSQSGPRLRRRRGTIPPALVFLLCLGLGPAQAQAPPPEQKAGEEKKEEKKRGIGLPPPDPRIERTGLSFSTGCV